MHSRCAMKESLKRLVFPGRVLIYSCVTRATFAASGGRGGDTRVRMAALADLARDAESERNSISKGRIARRSLRDRRSIDRSIDRTERRTDTKLTLLDVFCRAETSKKLPS